MRILAIETSCDETSLAIIETDGKQLTVYSHIILSQIDLHRQYGGVFPSLAKREHSRNLVPLLERAAQDPGIFNFQFSISKEISNDQKEKIEKTLEREPELLEQFLDKIVEWPKPKLDAIAVTHGPGLEPALWTGINLAKALSALWDLPVIPVDHMEGHIASTQLSGDENSKLNSKFQTENGKNFLEFDIGNLEFPAVALLVSGGHTELVLMKDWGQYQILGRTLDDAAGEAFDKAARVLDLSYPGGPEISKLANRARQSGLSSPFPLTRPMLNSDDLQFSFSGIKTSVKVQTDRLGELNAEQKAGIAREFEEAVVDTLVAKSETALDETGAQELLVAGGVSANRFLRERLEDTFGLKRIRISPPSLSGDNALMIALAAYRRAEYAPELILNDPAPLAANGQLSLEEPRRINKQVQDPDS